MRLPPCCAPSSRPRRLGSLTEQMWPVSTIRIKITKSAENKDILNWGCSNNTDLGPKKIAFFFPLPVQLTNIYSGPVIYSASCFSPGLLCQGLPLIGISPDEAAFGGQSRAEDPCLEGPGCFTHWAKTLALQFSSSVTVAK